MSASMHDAGQSALEQPQRRTWTVPEAAYELGVSQALLRDLIREGYVPVLRLGRRVLVRRATVERLLAEPEGAEAPMTQLLQARAERSQHERSSQRTARQAR